MDQKDLEKLVLKLSTQGDTLRRTVTFQQQQIQQLHKTIRHIKSRNDNLQGQLNTISHQLQTISQMIMRKG